jgi:uncharacterized membrane protein YqiK
VTIPKTRRDVPDWVLVTVAVALIVAVLGAVIWGAVVVITALTDREPGPAQVDVSWQCTQFGDRLYWPTDASRRTFAVVPGGCRT